MWTIVLLLISNIFMTFAWYGHLKYSDRPLWIAIVASWGIAFFEYCFQVPANRWGHVSVGGPFSAAQLKVIQEIITLVVFAFFSVWYLGERLRWNHLAALGCILAAVVFIFGFRGESTTNAKTPAAGQQRTDEQRSPA